VGGSCSAPPTKKTTAIDESNATIYPSSVRSLVLFAVILALAGCAMERHREQVRQGFFTRGLHREAFLKEWGQPSRTFSVPAPDPVYRAEAFGATWQRPVYEVWEYQARATCLTFDGVRLTMWETGKTDCEPKGETETRSLGPPPAPPYPSGR
jgi:hypothetical protein